MKFITSISFLFILLLFVLNTTLSGSDSTSTNEKRLFLKPVFFGVQIEGTSFLIVSEIGGLVDVDIYSSNNKRYSLGLRASVESYGYLSLNFAGASEGEYGPFIDYNLLARHSLRGRLFWFSLFGGVSLHTIKNEDNASELLFPRMGFELKYNLSKYALGIILKGASSFRDETGYLGIGLSLGLYDY